ncbi:MAG: hypothetical protein WCT03_01275 [Candidatus Obscuribacterales bacterium]|jgi:hypothetical protein
MKLSYLQSYSLATISAALLSFLQGSNSGDAIAAEHRSKSNETVQTYQLNGQNLELRVQVNAINGIAGFHVYKNKRLIQHHTLNNLKDDGFRQLAFPYIGKVAKTIRSFDGGINDFISDETKLASTPFVDLDGDGSPEIVVDQSIGNAGKRFHIYSLCKSNYVLPTLSTTRASAELIDIDQDGRCEVIAYDPTFFGWQTGNAQSAMPLVILRMRPKRFALAEELMRTKPPTQRRQKEMLSAWRKACEAASVSLPRGSEKTKSHQNTFFLSPMVWTDMLSLIYSGNSELAFSLLDEFWKDKACATNFVLEGNKDYSEVFTTKEQFNELFLHQLSYSSYLTEIKVLNKNDARIQNIAPALRK